MKRGDYDPVRNSDVNSRLERFQYILFISNLLLLVISLANFSICIWIRFDLDFWEWVLEINWYTYWNAMYVVMIAMVFHAFNNALSAYGTYSQSRAILVTSLVIRVITWFITLAGMVVICIYGVEESTILIKELDVVFRDIIQRIDSDPRANRILVQIQEYVGCCGATGNSLDFVHVRKPMPDSCRHPVTGNRYGYNCPQVLAWWLEPWTSTLAGISLFLCVTDFCIMVVTLRLRSYIRMIKET